MAGIKQMLSIMIVARLTGWNIPLSVLRHASLRSSHQYPRGRAFVCLCGTDGERWSRSEKLSQYQPETQTLHCRQLGLFLFAFNSVHLSQHDFRLLYARAQTYSLLASDHDNDLRMGDWWILFLLAVANQESPQTLDSTFPRYSCFINK